MSRLGIHFMRLLAHLPLAWIRAMGWFLGWFLYFVVVPRRRVMHTNLALCFPEWPAGLFRLGEMEAALILTPSKKQIGLSRYLQAPRTDAAASGGPDR